MPVKYINRKGQAHYLRAVTAKKGGTRYYIIKNPAKYPASELLENIPAGFEFYEHPGEAEVVLRKTLQTNITPAEKEIVEAVMQQHETVDDYIIDTEANALLIYTAHLSRDEFGFDEEHFKLIQSYNDVLRFEKTSSSQYLAQRFCHLSNYYGWITLETSHDLAVLAQKYCYHIDKESLLEFWIEGEEDW
jgi:hypothetical protein